MFMADGGRRELDKDPGDFGSILGFATNLLGDLGQVTLAHSLSQFPHLSNGS